MTASAARPLRVVIGEDQPDLALMLTMLVDQQPDMRCVGHAPDASGILRLAGEERADAYILDLSLEDGSSMPLVRRLRSAQPACLIIAFTGWSDPALETLCRNAGCDAIVHKDGQVAGLLHALRKPNGQSIDAGC